MPRAKAKTKKPANKKSSSPKKSAAKKTSPKKDMAKNKAMKRVSAKKSKPKKSATILNFPDKAISKKQTKAEIIADIAENTGLEKKTVKLVFEALKSHIGRHMKSRGSGEVTIPELGLKVRRVKKAATKKRKGRNPFTGEEIIIAAKPARTAVKAVALKALKELAEG